MPDSFLVHYTLNTLPQEYAPFKISYSTHKDKWSINELLIICVQKERRLLMEQGQSCQNVHLIVKRKNMNQVNKKGKGRLPSCKHKKRNPSTSFARKKGT